MADQKISQLNNIAGANVAADDEFVIVDTDANETKAIRADNIRAAVGLATTDSPTFAGLTTTNDATINGATVGLGGGQVATNFAIGSNALLNNTTGTSNTAIGADALLTNATGIGNTAIGANALRVNTANYNTAIGGGVLEDNTTGTQNIGIGLQALVNNTTGVANVAIGGQALSLNTTGSENTAIGRLTAYNATGSNGTAIGSFALFDLTSGTNNTAIGRYSGRGITTGSYNTVIGANVTGLSATLANNVIIADGQGNRRINIDGSGNVGIGTTSPNANAILDVTSTTKAFMPPRMTTAQRDAIASPAAGMVIYNTTTNVLNFHNGTAWGAV